MSQFAEEFSPERMAAVASLEKEVQYSQVSYLTRISWDLLQVACMNGEVDAMQAWMNNSDK